MAQTPTRTIPTRTPTYQFALSDSQVALVTDGLELLGASLRIHADMLLAHENPTMARAFTNRARRAERLGLALQFHEVPNDG